MAGCSRGGDMVTGSGLCRRRDSRPIAHRYLMLVRIEGCENLILFLLGNIEMVKASFELGRYLVELVGCNRELSVSFLQPELGLARHGGDVLEGPSRQRANPQCPHEL